MSARSKLNNKIEAKYEEIMLVIRVQPFASEYAWEINILVFEKLEIHVYNLALFDLKINIFAFDLLSLFIYM